MHPKGRGPRELRAGDAGDPGMATSHSCCLPFDWRDWSQTELRAVLAHELAHVVRGDFLTGLIAQISVAIHFYHPLAHWLAKRLRLEQELAADAWGAALSGGGPRPIS